MNDVILSSVSARTASILLAPLSNNFNLSSPIKWQLKTDDDRLVVDGVANSVALFVEGLEPDCTYEFSCGLGTLSLTTLPCAGLVDVTQFGVATSCSDNSKFFEEAIKAVPTGGTLFVPNGVYFSTPLFLKNDMTLYLAKGAVIAAISAKDNSDRKNWPILPAHDDEGRVLGTWEGLPEASYASIITAIDCNNLHITGSGKIDGGGERGDWWQWPKEKRNGARRPRTLFAAHCKDMKLSGITICNSPSWTVHPYLCENFAATNIIIENPHNSPNTDGLDPESCTNTIISGVRISVGDDCIAVKSGKRGTQNNDHLAPTKGMSISNCLMEKGHGAVVLGSEMSGDIVDVTIDRCEFIGTDRGLRIKTRRGRGGRVANIKLSNVTMQGVHTPLAINAFYYCDADGKSDFVQSRERANLNLTTPFIHDITLTNVTADNVHHAAAALLGLPEAPLKNIQLNNFTVSYDEDAIKGDPLMASHIAPVRHAGILCQFSELKCDKNLIPMQEEFSSC